MKLIVFLFLFLSFSASIIFAQKQVIKPENQNIQKTGKEAPLEFKETKHDFGKIKKNVPVTYEFLFKNISDQPIAIESAKAQCGCTTPEFPKAPVAKGEADKITITYNATNPGIFMKQVTIYVVNYERPFYLVVSGEVMPSSPQKEN